MYVKIAEFVVCAWMRSIIARSEALPSAANNTENAGGSGTQLAPPETSTHMERQCYSPSFHQLATGDRSSQL